MRTPEEILARINELESGDIFGFQREDLISFLPFDAAKPWLKEGCTSDDWEIKTPDQDTIKAEILDYLPFAWEKANNCRGLSAARSLDHMKAWLWLYDKDIYKTFEPKLADYDCYGKHQLAAISEFFGFPWREHDNGEWVNNEDGPHLGVNDDFSWLPEQRQIEERGTRDTATAQE